MCSDIAEQNICNLGEGWRLAERMTNLHGLALQRISSTNEKAPTSRGEASLLLGTHGLNLFLGFMNLIVRGRCDVASYLLRPILDCESLAFAVAGDEEMAKAFHADELRAADSRKKEIEFVRRYYPEQTSFLDSSLKDESNAANDLSHVNLTNVSRVLEPEGDTLTPVIGGRVDMKLASRLTAGALLHEYWHLVWFRAFFPGEVGDGWVTDWESLKEPLWALGRRNAAKAI